MNIYKGAKKALSGLAKFVFNIHVHGSENEPAEGGYIAVANHISFVDVFVTAVAVKRQIRFMAKKELFKIPLLGGLLKALGAFPVDRKKNAVSALKTSISLLESGEVVGIFPLGTRTSGKKFDTLGDMVKGGAAMVCYRAKVPVLPMFISTKNDKTRLFRRIDVYVGKPIAYEEFGFTDGGNGEYMQGAMLMYDRICELMPPERRS